jgi:hypothetical protein
MRRVCIGTREKNKAGVMMMVVMEGRGFVAGGFMRVGWWALPHVLRGLFAMLGWPEFRAI